MFDKPADEQLSAWLAIRREVETSLSPLTLISEFWSQAPFVPYNRNIDPYNQQSWPTPWEIIIQNQYDDFTRAIMMAYTVKYTNRYRDSQVEIRSFYNADRSQMLNLVYIDNTDVLNYKDQLTPVSITEIPDTLMLDNLVVII